MGTLSPTSKVGERDARASDIGDVGRHCSSPSKFCGGNLHVNTGGLILGSWNIEGLTDTKVVELQQYMVFCGIDSLCLQETHRYESSCGVVFWSRRQHVIALLAFVMKIQETSRMASLKLRVPGGKCSICCSYAPHSRKPRDERQDFYQKLATCLLSRSQHGPLMAMGDFLTRNLLACSMHIFGDGPRVHEPDCNQSLLLELCECSRLSIASTLFNEPPQRHVTCYSAGASPSSELTPKNFC